MLIVANWKAYVQSSEKAKKLFAGAKRITKPDIKIVLAPPAPYLGMFAPGNRSKVSIASQDLSLSTGGAATGEITAALLSDLGVTYSIIGHSERRAMGETDASVSEKVQHALANKIIPIVCVGESDRDADAKYLTALRAQLHAVFDPLAPKQRAQVVIAYEPIWAIGKPANEAITPDDLTEMVLAKSYWRIHSRTWCGENTNPVRRVGRYRQRTQSLQWLGNRRLTYWTCEC
jgi:triosephosphate isomerase